MDNIMDLIRKRKSIRAYKDKALPDDAVKSILEAARHAPTARNLQQLEYKVITSASLIQKLSDGITNALKQESAALPNRPAMPPMPARPSMFYKAPLLVLITGPRENSWIDADAALAAQNIMLYAVSAGLGSCFIGMARYIEKDKGLMQELHIADNKKIAAAVVCGYPDEDPPPKEKKLNAEFFK